MRYKGNYYQNLNPANRKTFPNTGVKLLKEMGYIHVDTIRQNQGLGLSEGQLKTAAEALAARNREEEGESVSSSSSHGNCKHKKKLKYGMLDKATANIEHKEVWPQKNLLLDLADAEIEFKQMMFEHLVAGELRTIETCTDIVEMRSRLRLLRRIAYLKIRGHKWQQIRTMYAAILRSIETTECTWASDFDRFEAVLTRKREEKKVDKPKNPKDWFCKDFNKPGGCREMANHWRTVGSGPDARNRWVLHICMACLLKDYEKREHAKTSEECPNFHN